jgi:AraC-like DNA-binding protein/mannose-6-phosphate isomerase-like protein (cupin superfamily)
MRRAPAVELLDLGTDRSFALRRTRAPHGWSFSWHRHSEWELTLILSGHGVRFIGDAVEDFAAGDLCLIPPDLPHTWLSRPTGTPGEAIVLQLPQALLAGAAALPEGRALRTLAARAVGGLHVQGGEAEALSAHLHALLASDGLSRYGGLLALLGRLASVEARPIAGHVLPASAVAERRLARSFALIEEHLASRISQRRVAAAVGMPPASFSRFFRRATGRTFVEHVGRRRIAAVCRDLIETDDPVLELALRYGWQGLAAFNRRFRALTGCTPTAYRRRSRPAAPA